jgi:hypothetical protein
MLKRLALLAGCLLIAAPAQARAGSLDRQLLGRSGDVLAYLKAKKLDTVGVLPFKVKRGTRPAGVEGGPIGLNLPPRLENSLILSMEPDEARAVGVIRDAAQTAAGARVGPYLTSERAFRKLFAQDYDLAWGGRKVKAKAFLTGLVVNAGSNRQETQVQIDLITPASWQKGKVVPVRSWTVKARTDAVLAADLGYNFSLSRAVLKRGVPLRRQSQGPAEQVTQEDQDGDRKPGADQTAAHTPDNIAGFSFELHYDGEKQELTTLPGRQGSTQPDYQAPPATPGSKIAMYLTRTDADKGPLGLLLMINGKSTWKEEDGEPISCRKWVYGPGARGRRDEWLGFYTGLDGKNLLPFKTLTAEESEAEARQLGARAGWIDVFVFASGEGDNKPHPGTDDKDGKAGDKADSADYASDMMVTLRGMPRSRSNKTSLAELRAALLKANNLRDRERLVTKRSAGGLILHEMEPVEGGTIGTADLPNPVLIGHLAIRYYELPGRKIEE